MYVVINRHFSHFNTCHDSNDKDFPIDYDFLTKKSLHCLHTNVSIVDCRDFLRKNVVLTLMTGHKKFLRKECTQHSKLKSRIQDARDESHQRKLQNANDMFSCVMLFLLF